jgi:hypothetical protein
VIDSVLRGVGVVVAVWGAIVVALYGAFLTPLRWGAALVPMALVLAVLGNLLLIRYAYEVSGNRWLALVPGGIWLVVSFTAAGRTTEGDLVLLQSNWVATVYLFAGAGTIAVAAYRLMNRPSPASQDPLAQDPLAQDRGAQDRADHEP